MGAVAFLGPVGFLASSIYFIADAATDGFGEIGEMLLNIKILNMKWKYSYIIYKIYSWTSGKSDTPVVNTILTLAVVHFFQLATILLFIDRIISPLYLFQHFNKVYIFLGAIIYFIIFWLLIYNKNRWNVFIEEYSKETMEESKGGSRIVLFLLIGSIVLFFISLPVLFTVGKYLNR